MEIDRSSGVVWRKQPGVGLPVVYLHGFAEEADNCWGPFLKNMPDHAHLLIDFPWVKPGWKLPMFSTVEAGAEAVREVLDSTQVPQCILAGHSMGGYIALAFAEKYPDRLQGLALFHAHTAADSAEKRLQRTREASILRSRGSGNYLQQLIPGLFSGHWRSIKGDYLAARVEACLAYDPEALALALEAMRDRADRSGVLEKLPCPLFLLTGSDDPLIPVGQTLQEACKPRVTQLEVLEGQNHMSQIEMPEQVVRCFENFISMCRR